jgi:glycosyltransferase involved in cell wall biosynthesis
MISSPTVPDDNQDTAQSIHISALVPVYNEAETIEEIVRRLEEISIIRQIVVVDDGSFDETPLIVKRLSDAGRVLAHFHEHNCGKGAALRNAVELATEDYLVIQDADLEYDPQDFYAMAKVVQETGAQVVYGSRFLNAQRTGMLWTHYLGNRFLTILFNMLYGQRLTDMETCYKLFRTDLLQQLGIANDRFDIDPELTAKIVCAGHKIYEVPVSYTGRPYLAGKKIRPADALSAIKTLWDYRHWQPKYSPTKRG